MHKNIAFYISDHNMEHVLRTIPVLQNMLKIEDNVNLFVKSGKAQIELVKFYVNRNDRVHFQEMEMREREIELFNQMAEGEEAFLKENQIGLVLSDMCPWIFIAADTLRIKSVLLANYTWADLCEDEEEKEEYLSCYELAGRMFIYDLHVPELTGYGVEYELVSMISRPYHMEEIEEMEHKLGGPYIFVDAPEEPEDSKEEYKDSFCEKVDVSGISARFVITEGTPLTGDNVIVLSKDIANRQDYMAASRFLIASGSWNHIAEAVLANRKAAFVVREEIPMSRQMVETLVQRGQGILLEKNRVTSQEQAVLKLEELLLKIKEFSYSYDHEYYNSDYDLAKKILFAYPEKRRRNRS